MTAASIPFSPALANDRYKYKYLIAITVSLASVLELLDTSIVNVAIPHMMGNLGATLDQIAWVSTGYIVANVIVLPITGWLSAYFGRRRYFAAAGDLGRAALPGRRVELGQIELVGADLPQRRLDRLIVHARDKWQEGIPRSCGARDLAAPDGVQRIGRVEDAVAVFGVAEIDAQPVRRLERLVPGRCVGHAVAGPGGLLNERNDLEPLAQVRGVHPFEQRAAILWRALGGEAGQDDGECEQGYFGCHRV